MSQPEYKIIVSWSPAEIDGEGADCACYCVAIYRTSDMDGPLDFATVDDDGTPDADRACLPLIRRLADEYQADAGNMQVEWDV